MIDRLREQLQERLDQLLSEADRLRKALAALGPRSPKAPPRELAARETARGDRLQAGGFRDQAHASPADSQAGGPLPSPDGARRHEGRRACRAGRQPGDDRRRGRGQGRSAPRDRVDDALQAGEVRRGREGRARLPAAIAVRDDVLPRWHVARTGRSPLDGGATVGRCSRSASGSTSTPSSSAALPIALTAPSSLATCHPARCQSRRRRSIGPTAARASARDAARRSRRCSPIRWSARSRRSFGESRCTRVRPGVVAGDPPHRPIGLHGRAQPSLVGIPTVRALVRPLVHGSGSRRRVALPERSSSTTVCPLPRPGRKTKPNGRSDARSLAKRHIRFHQSGESGPIQTLVRATLEQREIDALALELPSLALRREPGRGPCVETLDLLPPHPGIDHHRDAPGAAAGRRQGLSPRRPTAGARTPPRTLRG